MTWAIAVLYALDLNATILQISIITTIWGTMGIFLQVPFGILSDRFGRKRLLLITQALMLLGTALSALAADANQLILASFVGGFAGGSFFPILISTVGDLASSEKGSEAIASLYFFSAVGMLLGPTVASVILNLPFVHLRTIYQIDSVFQTFVLLYIVFMIKEPEKASEITARKGGVAKLLREGSMLAAMIMIALFMLYDSIMNTYVPIYARKDVGLSDAQIASFSGYKNLAITLIRLSSITILSKLNIKRFLIFALILGGAVGLALLYSNNYPGLVLLMLLYGASFGVTLQTGPMLVADIATPSDRGMVNSLYSLAQSSGAMTQMLVAPIAETSLMLVFMLGGALSLLATVPIMTLISNARVRDKQNTMS